MQGKAPSGAAPAQQKTSQPWTKKGPKVTTHGHGLNSHSTGHSTDPLMSHRMRVGALNGFSLDGNEF